jgi:4-diphosphocytidyl-2-C-methyl-D-erythritol kinase
MPPDASPRTVGVRAFAKINLTLHVLGRRADGYHEVRTTFQSLALHDILRCQTERGPFRIECNDPACPADRANLVWRAAEQVWRATGRRGAVRDTTVRIRKRIPIQAGLGGGSSDAAAALRALALLWRVRLTGDRLRDMAAELGADVPFFLDGGTALGLERGDLLFPLIDRPTAWVVLALPGFGVSTTDAYRWFDRDGGARVRSSAAGNDLEGPVARRHPAIGRLARALRSHGASHAAMSGSGSAVFGLFATRAAAQVAAAAVGSRNCRTFVTRTISRRQCQSAAAPKAR